MKRGAAYEQFVYEKLCRLFPDAKVTLNDKIRGLDSDLEREIDVSIRLKGVTLICCTSCNARTG